MLAEIIGAIVVILLSLTGIIVSLFGISGTWLVFLSAIIYDLIVWEWAITIHWLILLLALATAGEIIEFSLGGITARKYGASKAGVIAAIAGGIIGAIIGIPGMLFGSILGLLIGSFIGAFAVEMLVKKDINKALTAAIGAFIGGLGGKLAKLMILLIMIIIVLVLVF